VASKLKSASLKIQKFALSLPEAYEEFPWGERVAKVKGKVFAFLGKGTGPVGGLSFTVKLPMSGDFALTLPFTEPTGYGLGKSGWVTARLGPNDEAPVEMFYSWIEESYKAVAPKKLAAQLEAGEPVAPPASKKKAAKPSARPASRRAKSKPAARKSAAARRKG